MLGSLMVEAQLDGQLVLLSRRRYIEWNLENVKRMVRCK